MDSSTETQVEIAVSLTGEAAIIGQDWQRVETIMPPDLEMTARATCTLVRRRGIWRAIDLLRIVLAYSTTQIAAFFV